MALSPLVLEDNFIEDVIFFGLDDVLVTSGRRAATLISMFSLQHAASNY